MKAAMTCSLAPTAPRIALCDRQRSVCTSSPEAGNQSRTPLFQCPIRHLARVCFRGHRLRIESACGRMPQDLHRRGATPNRADASTLRSSTVYVAWSGTCSAPSLSAPLCPRADRQPGAWRCLRPRHAGGDRRRARRISARRRSAARPVPHLPRDLVDAPISRKATSPATVTTMREGIARARLSRITPLVAPGAAADRDGGLHARGHRPI